MAPVVTLAVAIQQTRWIEAGETSAITRNGPPRGARASRRCLAGYADGLPRGAGAINIKSRAPKSAVAGRRCPLVGRVSIDLSIVD